MKFLALYSSTYVDLSLEDILLSHFSYVPEDRCRIDPDIIREQDFTFRLEHICAEYLEDQHFLKSVLPIISKNIGTFNIVKDNLAIWIPTVHLSLLGQLLISSTIEILFPKYLEPSLYYVADVEDSGAAFSSAFSMEKKYIFVPDSLVDKVILSENNTMQTLISFSEMDKASLKQCLCKNRKVVCDRSNFFRILGNMATIIEALFSSESSRWRFYQDPIDLVLPADSLEFILAAFYLKQASFPINRIHAVSSHHRMVHSFLQKGMFEITNLDMFNILKISLDRMLFESARGSLDKINHWSKMRRETRSFKVDTKTFDLLKSAINPVFCNPNSFVVDMPKDEMRLAHIFPLLCQKIAEEHSCKVIGFNLANPHLSKYTTNMIRFTDFVSNQ